MKKYISILAAIVALALVSCQKTEPTQPENGVSKVATLKAVVSPETRVSVDDAGTYAWQAGDRIAVIDNEGNANEFTTTQAGASVDFTTATAIELGDYAVYPYDANTMAEENMVIVNLPSTYTYKEGATNIPMLGKIVDGTATFKAIGGVLKLTVIGVPSSATSLSFSATNKKIIGDFTIADASVESPSISVAAKGASDNVVSVNFSESRADNMVFYIPLPTGTIDGFTVAFDDGTTKTSSKSVNIERNGLVIAPVLNFTSSPASTLFLETWGEYSGSVANYDFSGTTTADGLTNYLTYTVSSTNVTCDGNTAGNTPTKNLYFAKGTYSFEIAGIKLNGATSITITYDVNKADMGLSYKIDNGNYVSLCTSSTAGAGVNSFTVNNISGTTLGLKFGNTNTSNNRLDNIKVVSSGSAGTASPVISIGSDAITIAAGSLSNSVTSVKLSNPMDASGISFVIDPESYWISSAEIIDGDINTGDAKVRITADSYNHSETARVGYVYFRATGATSKTITVTQNPSIVPSPSLTATPDNANFTITWTADGKAKSYVGYYGTTELSDPTSGVSLDITNTGSAYSATPSATVANGTTYHVYVKVNEVADGSAGKYAASSVWAHTTVVPEAPTTIADVISGGVDGGPYSVYGLTCFASIDKNNAIVGDNTGRMLLYKSGDTGHGLANGDVFNIVDGSTTLYSKAIYEWSNPSVTKTGTTTVDHGTATVLDNTSCGTLVSAFDGSLHSAVYVSGTGVKNGRDITIGNYTLYLGVARGDIADGDVNFSGYVYGYMSSKLSFMATSMTVVGDPTVTAFEWTRSATTNTVTTGYTLTAEAESKTGYYQDGSGTLRYITIHNASTPMFTSAPSSITVTAKLGGGTAKDPLANSVYVCLVDQSGDPIQGTETVITTKITDKDGSEFSVNITPVATAYGARVYHTKESGYNVRYYSLSLKYIP